MIQICRHDLNRATLANGMVDQAMNRQVIHIGAVQPEYDIFGVMGGQIEQFQHALAAGPNDRPAGLTGGICPSSWGRTIVRAIVVDRREDLRGLGKRSGGIVQIDGHLGNGIQGCDGRSGGGLDASRQSDNLGFRGGENPLGAICRFVPLAAIGHQPEVGGRCRMDDPVRDGNRDEVQNVAGIVKWFDPRKGFGFLVGPQNEDVFVHYSVIEGDGFKVLKDGSHVTYDAARSGKGWKATRCIRSERVPEIEIVVKKHKSAEQTTK